MFEFDSPVRENGRSSVFFLPPPYMLTIILPMPILPPIISPLTDPWASSLPCIFHALCSKEENKKNKNKKTLSADFRLRGKVHLCVTLRLLLVCMCPFRNWKEVAQNTAAIFFFFDICLLALLPLSTPYPLHIARSTVENWFSRNRNNYQLPVSIAKDRPSCIAAFHASQRHPR